MDDRMEIAKDMMAAMRGSSSWSKCVSETLAKQAIADADALLKALAEAALEELTETAQAAGEYDEVGDWTQYIDDEGIEAARQLAVGNVSAENVFSAFGWASTPQGPGFWIRLWQGNASAADKARAQDFARRVLAQMEADGE